MWSGGRTSPPPEGTGFLNFRIISAQKTLKIHPHDCEGFTECQAGAMLNEMCTKFVLFCYSELMPHPSPGFVRPSSTTRKHRGALSLCANRSLGCSANCSFQQDKGIQMWETIKFFPTPLNRWLSSKKRFFCEGRKRIHLCYLGSALMLLRLKWTIIQVTFTQEQMKHCAEMLLM